MIHDMILSPSNAGPGIVLRTGCILPILLNFSRSDFYSMIPKQLHLFPFVSLSSHVSLIFMIPLDKNPRTKGGASKQ